MKLHDSDDGILLSKRTHDSSEAQWAWLHSVMIHLFPETKSPQFKLNWTDCVLIIVFLFLGVLSRAIRIQYPKNVVAGEEICGWATNNYLNGTYFEDRHPPLPRLILSAVAKFAGYQANYNFEAGSRYNSMFYVMLRLIPAFFGSLCVPLSYLLMRMIGVSVLGSATASFIVAGEPLMIVQSRLYKGDALFHLFAIITLISVAMWRRHRSLWFLVLEGVCLGCVVACKHTSGGIVLLAVLEQFPLQLIGTRSFWKRSGTAITKSCILGLVILLIQFLVYSIHLTILPYKGTDNPPEIIAEALVNTVNPDWIKRSRASSIFRCALVLMWHNHRASMSVQSSAAYTSAWWTWPFAVGKWFPLWHEGDRHLILIANPLIWLPVLFGVIVNVFRVLIEGDWSSDLSSMLFGYCFSYFPFIFLSRDLYIFHYVIPLLFGIFQLVMLIDRIESKEVKGFLFYFLISLAAFAFLFWNPLFYGKTVRDLDFLVWYKGWLS